MIVSAHRCCSFASDHAGKSGLTSIDTEQLHSKKKLLFPIQNASSMGRFLSLLSSSKEAMFSVRMERSTWEFLCHAVWELLPLCRRKGEQGEPVKQEKVKIDCR